MYLTAMSAVSIHNLVSNLNEATLGQEDIVLQSSNVNWTWNDSDIYSAYPQCNGSMQSPINIRTNYTKENLNLRLGLTAYDKPITGLLVNQFPTFILVPLSYRWPRPTAFISVSNARTFNPYADSHFSLSHVHFYWSKDVHKNLSLHRIDDETFPVELNLVHINTAYSDFDEALSKPNGLLILSVLVVQSTYESYIFDKLLDDLVNLTTPNSQSIIDEDSTWRSLLPSDTSRFYRYQGSINVPPCHQSVQWIIFDEKLKLGQRQLKRLRRFRFFSKNVKDGLQIDWSTHRRPLQETGGRLVERSFSSRSNENRRYLLGG